MVQKPIAISSYDRHRGENAMHDFDIFDSPRCGGKYHIDKLAQLGISELNEDEILLLVEYIRRKNFSETIIVNTELIEDSKKISPPTIGERYNRGLISLTKICPKIGKSYDIGGGDPENTDRMAAMLGATFSNDFLELKSYLEEYKRNQLIEIVDDDKSIGKIRLKPRLQAFRHLEQEDRNKSNVFIAMWFDETMSSAWQYGIEPAVRESGYIPIRIDKKEHNNKIDDEIIAEIRNCRFLVADFSSKRDQPRGGVYFEAGFAVGLGIPVIWCCREDLIDQVHFDTRQFNHIVWTDDEDLKNQLRNRIVATIGFGPNISKHG